MGTLITQLVNRAVKLDVFLAVFIICLFVVSFSSLNQATPSLFENIVALWTFATEYNCKFHLYKYTYDNMQYIIVFQK